MTQANFGAPKFGYSCSFVLVFFTKFVRCPWGILDSFLCP